MTLSNQNERMPIELVEDETNQNGNEINCIDDNVSAQVLNLAIVDRSPDPEPTNQTIALEEPEDDPVAKAESDYAEELEVAEPLLEYCLRKDEGDADLFCLLNRDRYVYSAGDQCWFRYEEGIWTFNRLAEEHNDAYHRVRDQYALALQSMRRVHEQICDDTGKDPRRKNSSPYEWKVRAFKQKIDQLCTRPHLKRVMAWSTERAAVTYDQWDANKNILAFGSRVINIRTLEEVEPNPEHLLRGWCPVEYTGIDTPCGEWDEFMWSVFEDQELIDYVQTLFGYSLLGSTDLHKFHIFVGDQGFNGKSTIMNVILELMGHPDPYSLVTTLPTNTILQGNKTSGDAPTPYLHDVIGRRLVFLSETAQDRQWNVAQLKWLSGGDWLVSRTLYGQPIKFKASHSMILGTNHLPNVPANEAALWKRLVVVPFPFSFVENPNPNNPHHKQIEHGLERRLLNNREGILAWILRGTQRYLSRGLIPPAKIHTRTEEYKTDEDMILEFATQYYDVSLDIENRIRQQELYDDFKEFLKDNGYKPRNSKTFRNALDPYLEDVLQIPRAEFKYKSNGVTTYRYIRVSEARAQQILEHAGYNPRDVSGRE